MSAETDLYHDMEEGRWYTTWELKELSRANTENTYYTGLRRLQRRRAIISMSVPKFMIKGELATRVPENFDGTTIHLYKKVTLNE